MLRRPGVPSRVSTKVSQKASIEKKKNKEGVEDSEIEGKTKKITQHFPESCVHAVHMVEGDRGGMKPLSCAESQNLQWPRSKHYKYWKLGIHMLRSSTLGEQIWTWYELHQIITHTV